MATRSCWFMPRGMLSFVVLTMMSAIVSNGRAGVIYGDGTGFQQVVLPVFGGPIETNWIGFSGPGALSAYVSGYDYGGTGTLSYGWSAVSFDLSQVDPNSTIKFFLPVTWVFLDSGDAIVGFGGVDEALSQSGGPPGIYYPTSSLDFRLTFYDLLASPLVEINLGVLKDLEFLAGKTHLLMSVYLASPFARTPSGDYAYFEVPYLQVDGVVFEPSSLTLAATALATLATFRKRFRSRSGH